MSFKFRLQNLLDLKESIEKQKKEEFGNAMFVLNREEDILQAMIKEKISAIERREKDKENLKIERVRQYTLYIEMISQKIKNQEIKVEELRIVAEEKKEIMLEAIKETKSFEKLKEHDYEVFLEEEKKIEEKLNDSIVTFNTMKQLSEV